MDGWLTFLSSEEPEDILALLERYPDFKGLYDHVYQICRNMENIMGIFSEELKMLDENTVQYMIDEMQETINNQKKMLLEQDNALVEKDTIIAEQDTALAEKNTVIAEQENKIIEMQKRLQELEELLKK